MKVNMPFEKEIRPNQYLDDEFKYTETIFSPRKT